MLFDTSSSISGVDKEYIDDLISKIKLKQGTPGLDSKNIEIRKGEESLEWRYSTEVSNLVDFKSDFVKAIVNKEDIVKNLIISNISPNAKYVQIKTITVFGIDERGNLIANLNPSINTAPPGKKFEYFGGFDPTRGAIELFSNTEIDGNMSIQTVVDNVVPAFKDERIIDISEIILRVYLLDSEMNELKQVKVSYTVNKTSNNTWNNLIDLSELKGSQGEKGERGKTGIPGVNGKEIELRSNNNNLEYRYCTDIEPFVDYTSDFTQIDVNAEDNITKLIFKDLLPKTYKYAQIKIVTIFGESEEGKKFSANIGIETAPEGVSFKYLGGFDPTIGEVELLKPELEGNMSINDILTNKSDIFGTIPVAKINKVMLWLYFLNTEKEVLTENKVIFVVKSQNEEETTNPWKQVYDLSTLKGEKGEQGTKGADGREIEIQKGDTHIQWKYVGDVEWKNIVSLEEIKGDTSTVEVNSEIERLNQKISELELKIEAVKLEWEDTLLL